MSLSETFRQPDNALVQALRQLLDAPSVEKAKIVLDRHQKLLVTDAAVKLLHAFYMELMRESPSLNMYNPAYVGYHYSLLAVARMRGIPQAWKEMDQQLAPIRTTREQLNFSFKRSEDN